MTILDKLTLWTTKLEIAACVGNGIALLISIPTSQSVSSIYFAFFFFVVIFWVLNYFWSNVIKRNNSITLKADLKKERTLKYSVVLYIVCGCVIFSLVSTFLFDSNKVDIPQDVNLCTKDIEKETNKNGYRLLYKGSLYTGDVYSIDNNCLWETTNGFPYKIVIKDVVPDIKAEMVSEEYKIVITLYHPNNKVALICNIPHSKQNGISMKFFNKNGLEISMDDFREVCPVVWNAYDKVYFKLLNKYENEISEIKEKTLW